MFNCCNVVIKIRRSRHLLIDQFFLCTHKRKYFNLALEACQAPGLSLCVCVCVCLKSFMKRQEREKQRNLRRFVKKKRLLYISILYKYQSKRNKKQGLEFRKRSVTNNARINRTKRARALAGLLKAIII